MSVYRITEFAQTDLERIWEYTLHEWSLDQADKYIDGLLTCFDDIARGKTHGKESDAIRVGYRRANFGKHYVFYRIGQDKIVEIIRVLHVSMDVERHL